MNFSYLRSAILCLASLGSGAAALAQPDGGGDLRQIVEEQQARIEALEGQIGAGTPVEQTVGQPARFSFGGYGSVRAETMNLDESTDTFTFRRFVLSGDGPITDRVSAYFELEFERFTELELEKSVETGEDGFAAEQAVEGTNGSEISLEQAWTRFAVTPALNVDIGALLVPLGRFNINHDDNQWDLPRRSLVDRGVPVLPAAAAWPELGVGLTGTTEVGDGLIDFRIYVVNGAQLEFELEEEVEAELDAGDVVGVSKLEAKFGPSRGGFARDVNDNKALAARVAFRPTSAHEIAVSAYDGRYTPAFMTGERVGSIAVDGLHQLGRIALEYELVRTDWGDLESVAASFAEVAISHEVQATVPAEDEQIKELTSEIALAGTGLAASTTGYWLEIRRPFWPSRLDGSVLGRGFASPTFTLALRLEGVRFDDQLTALEFENRNVTELALRDATLHRATLGIAYRPSPRWVVSLAGEYTWTDQDSLAGLTNFLAAQPGEDSAFALLAGAAFAF